MRVILHVWNCWAVVLRPPPGKPLTSGYQPTIRESRRFNACLHHPFQTSLVLIARRWHPRGLQRRDRRDGGSATHLIPYSPDRHVIKQVIRSSYFSYVIDVCVGSAVVGSAFDAVANLSAVIRLRSLDSHTWHGTFAIAPRKLVSAVSTDQ